MSQSPAVSAESAQRLVKKLLELRDTLPGDEQRVLDVAMQTLRAQTSERDIEALLGSFPEAGELLEDVAAFNSFDPEIDSAEAFPTVTTITTVTVKTIL